MFLYYLCPGDALKMLLYLFVINVVAYIFIYRFAARDIACVYGYLSLAPGPLVAGLSVGLLVENALELFLLVVYHEA